MIQIQEKKAWRQPLVLKKKISSNAKGLCTRGGAIL